VTIHDNLSVGEERQPIVRQEGNKQFFFEKKNQKTFTLWHAYRSSSSRRQQNKSLLVLFFRKELLP
jgi:hypothetical protein